MVSFGLKLDDNIREQWREYYINYAALKKLLKVLKYSAGEGGGEGSDSDNGEPSNRLAGLLKVRRRKRPSTSVNHVSEEETRGLVAKGTAVAPPASYNTGQPEATGEKEELHNSFRTLLLAELDKVERFYHSQLADLRQRFFLLKGQLMGHSIVTTDTSSAGQDVEAATAHHKLTETDVKNIQQLGPQEKDYVEKTLIELSRDMALLQNFNILNYTGFVKILKKHDKLDPDRPLRPSTLPLIERSDFFRHIALDTLIKEVTTVFAAVFCNRDTNLARALLLPKRSAIKPDYFLLHLGYKLGVAATLAFWVVWDCVVQVAKFGKPTIVVKPAFPIYRGVGGLLILHWCTGLFEMACNSLRINYVYLLDLHPKHVSSPRFIFDEAVNESIVYLASMLLYYKVLVGGFPDWLPPGFYPLILLVYTLYCLLTPFRQRKGLWIVLFKVITSPLFPVTFLDTLVADALTSLVKVLLDLTWSVGYFVSGDFLRDVPYAPEDMLGQWENGYIYSKVLAPIVVILPLWWRFMQCLRRAYDTRLRWPHLANATKYSLAQMVTLFGAFHHVYYYNTYQHRRSSFAYDVVWVIITVISTCYSYLWDVTQDWGLGDPHKRFLNDRRMGGRDWPYYVAIVLDLFLRFLWVNTLIPPGSGGLLTFPLYMNALLMVLEILRRMGWGVLRLENEQLRNTQGLPRGDGIPNNGATEDPHQNPQPNRISNLKVMVELALVAGFVILMSIGAVVIAEGIDDAGDR